MAAPDTTTFETITSVEAFAACAAEWDLLVARMPRPSPFLLHGWLSEWWRHFAQQHEVVVHLARRDGRLIAGLPLLVRRRLGSRVAEFLGGGESALADLLCDDEERSAGTALVRRARASAIDVLDLFGLPANSRVSEALAALPIRLIERIEAPVLDLHRDSDGPYQKLTQSRRRELRRRSRKLHELGRVEVTRARALEELELALEEAFTLHGLRWQGRPDRSTFAGPLGQQFHRAALRVLGRQDHARIVLLKLDGRAIAFHYDFVLSGRMYGHRLGFDPALSHLGPGIITTIDALRFAAEEGLTRFEFLGGAERYKLEFADRFEPLYQGFAPSASARSHAFVAARIAAIRARLYLKRVVALRRLYYVGLTPLRRAADRLARRDGGQ